MKNGYKISLLMTSNTSTLIAIFTLCIRLLYNAAGLTHMLTHLISYQWLRMNLLSGFSSLSGLSTSSYFWFAR